MAATDRTPTSETIPGIPKKTSGAAAAATGTALGAAAGAAAGAIAGPPGIVAGAILGAVAGAATGEALVENDEDQEAVNAKLDREIGVTGGNIGASMTTMPARIGAYSSGSAGIAPPESANEEGGTGVVGSDESDD
jgi:hypothetical protein